MLLTIGTIPETVNIDHVNETIIRNNLAKLDGETVSYLILTDPESQSYIQCAGNHEQLTVELRRVSGNEFKHHVLGAKTNTNNFSWVQITCKVGPIHVHDNEVMTADDALQLFLNFLNDSVIAETYVKRNVTTNFL